MKRKKDAILCLQRQSAIKGKGPLAVVRRLPSLFAQTQTSLFSSTAFEASGDDFQEPPLLREDKSICTTLKAAKKDISAPGSSNAVTSDKTRMPTVDNDTSVQAVLLAPIPSTSCTSAPIKTNLIKLTRLKRKKKRTSQTEPPKPNDTVEETFVIKISLANICKYPKFVTLIQEVVGYITQLV
ncbi:hypothetical protein BCV72DRAFT_308705 [Rhizopus microsporus var. microsporus]|uniref:Uncharacterized protein n=1 Tax=Rhizopus microsporus var. microsporus TaxID=86635 RepID=A0A1X0QT50_RHIZD|nr:hypothetical protein BCV72DRAFT_308705 [Rhizopus microsporus var. microsporus]